eukprot:TRINITY_DN15267_c0_g1_i1.p1 TRINITY_DN15267_c0_g1~~TRINITY_DN15267_c0_g1_i1.p1  ORF type:complete len:123 (-),score=27.53 TRINITY_DN15267_c0_g1_i1:14-382(-)
MRILSHNMLMCNVKGCGAGNFPLRLAGTPVQNESEFNQEFMSHMYSKLDWPALKQACGDVGITTLPEEPPANPEGNQEFLKTLHDIIIDTHIQQGSLTCNNCKRVYPINNGIPNMLLNENEV